MSIAKYKDKKFEFDEEFLDVNYLPEISHDDARDLLFNLQNVFNEKKIKLYLAYGTLLGAIRDHDFIKGDLDLDVYIKDEKTFFNNLDYFKQQGFSLIRARINNGYSFRYMGNTKCYVDVIILGKIFGPFGIYCYRLGSHVIPKKYFENETEIEFLGRKFACVSDPIKILEFWYGPTWNVPIGKSEKKYTYDDKYYYIYKTIKNTIKKPIRYIYRLVFRK